MADPNAESRPARLLPLAGYYLLYFGTVGITLPFFPAYLKSLSFSGRQVGIILALGPAMAMVGPPLWGALADRTGRADRVLRIVSVGTAICFVPILFVQKFAWVFGAALLYAFFYTSITALVDSVALRRVALLGGSYSRIRLFGSFGFILASTAFGLSVSVIDRRAVIAILGFMIAFSVWSFFLRAPASVGVAPHPLAGLRLLRNRDVALLLCATCLHWIACSPYHGTFSIHVTALGHAPSIVGFATSLGVVAEVVVMLGYPRFAGRFAPRHLLAISFAASALRWLLLSAADGSAAIIAIQALHGLTFGTFYLASVEFMDRRAPPELRASGQALFAAITFGVGGLVGYLSAGSGYDWLGGHRLFAAAAAVEIVAALIVLQVHPPEGISAKGTRPQS